jgi:hypothetical protein
MSSLVGLTVSGGMLVMARGILPSGHIGYVFVLGAANAAAQHIIAKKVILFTINSLQLNSLTHFQKTASYRSIV